MSYKPTFFNNFAAKFYTTYQKVKMKFVFIVNPISGTKGKQHIVKLLPDYFEEGSYAIRYTERAGHAEELAREAAAQGTEVVVAVGGDGTVNEVACGLVHTATALGIVPCGSGNGLARHLGIPMRPEKALEVLRAMDIRTCDYGMICGHPFFCTAGVGFDAQVSYTFAHAGKRGLPTYLKTTIGVGMKYQGEDYTIEIHDHNKQEQKRCWLVTAANAAQYGNDFFIAPKASVCDGLLDVNIWTTFNKFTSPMVGLSLHNGTIDQNKHGEVVRCKKITIHRENEGPIQWDGDPSEGPKDVVIEAVEGGIHMVVGKPRKNVL